jgi:glycine/D-amino acid oxidase-like deaminating enzyme
MTADNALDVDVLIIGGGVAGLWTLAKLRREGYSAVLLESDALGAGQTRYAQGIIHGGTKYALTGKLTASSEAVADMPAHWRACHAGVGELDISDAKKLSDAHYLWSTSALTSRISGFFASKVMRSRTASLEDTARPALFSHPDFRGQIYQLDEPVYDTLSVLLALAEPMMDHILEIDASSVEAGKDSLAVKDKQGASYTFNYQQLVLMAGSGNRDCLAQLGYSQPEMQLRPLKMVMMRGDLHDRVFAHCLGASVNPRVTITSHTDEHNNIVWYLGGQLAEEGVKRSNTEQISQAQKELAELIPWLSLTNSEWGILDIDRAEVRKPGGARPDTYYASHQGRVITAWPTKLALAPVLAQHVLQLVADSGVKHTGGQLPTWPRPTIATFPWCEPHRWGVH